MSTTTITEDRVELSTFGPQSTVALTKPTPPTSVHNFNSSPHGPDEVPEDAPYSVSAIPDGGYGWVIVAAGFLTTFCHNGIINCWGVLQAALLDSTMSHVPPSTLAYVGSMALAEGALFGLVAVRMMRWVGSRITILVGVFLMGMSLVGASFCTSNLAGLFGTAGFVGGVGMAMVYAATNALPVQYFSARLGLANGLIKLGGGIGGCVMAIALNAMYRKIGIAWTFRAQGMMTLALGMPAAWMMKDRVPLRNVPFVDWSMFRSVPFIMTFIASAIGVFALYVPPYYLPLFAQSIGLSSSTGAGLVAAFNACNAIGRFAAGPLCDRIGPLNTFVITMVLNAASMLAIWPVSNTLGPLMIFAMLNGVANGSYFTTQPTVVAGIFGPGRATIAMSMSVTGWSAGYFMGAPIAGYLLKAAGGIQGHGSTQSIDVYRPAIFYAGGMATLSALGVLAARVTVAKKWRKRI
ncbi:major facilitator superfamily domain-containing protein [Paraphoma chrysanthemicola]|uniref:Major facilitator superfamily domain-containing protein n=1 Tax=Paraphoma chrysanthemicola TaxID=798071 RepID=A0A8K0RHN3_9PLEO|nr:major facilitator superfamily domain-containing protein [Paraphoma chrysanthemicola]